MMPDTLKFRHTLAALHQYITGGPRRLSYLSRTSYSSPLFRSIRRRALMPEIADEHYTSLII